MSLSLREVDKHSDDPLHRKKNELADLFEEDKQRVQHAAASPLFPEIVVLATKRGFVQLVSLVEGTFRLFITYVADVPLDVPLRCLQLSPGLHIACAKQHHVVYALAHSSQLLVANLTNQKVSVLFTFRSRPRTVFCDGDFIVCGDASGHVAAWRTLFVAKGLESLQSRESDDGMLDVASEWARQIHRSEVTQAAITRGAVITASAEYTICVSSLSTGETLSMLAGEAAPTCAITPLPSTLDNSVLVCSENGIITAWSPDSQLHSWMPTGVLNTQIKVRSMTQHNNFAAVGGSDGCVALYDATTPDSMQTLACFELGHPIVMVQPTSDEHLVVVTSCGELWRWPLQDVVATTSTSANDGTEMESSSKLPEVCEEEPQPSPLPPPAPTQKQSPEAEAAQDRGEAKYAGDGEDDNEDGGSHADDEENGDEEAHECSDAEEERKAPFEYDEAAPFEKNVDGAAEVVIVMDEPPIPTPPLEPADAATTVSNAPSQHGGTHTEEDNASCPPSSVVCTNNETGLSSVPPPRNEPQESAPPVPSRAQLNNDGGNGRTGERGKTEEERQSESRKDDIAGQQREWDAIQGLKPGRRMAPGAARAAVDREEQSTHRDPVASARGMEVVPQHSPSRTSAIAVEREKVLKEEFDVNRFIKEHQSEASAVAFQHPLPNVRYEPDEIVFRAVGLTAPLQTQRAEAPAQVDDYMPATAANKTVKPKFNPTYLRERSLAGPDIRQHLCDSLLFPSSISTLFFVPTSTVPSAGAPLLLPMPLPPPPNVF